MPGSAAFGNKSYVIVMLASGRKVTKGGELTGVVTKKMRYQLRNDKSAAFKIEARGEGGGQSGATVRARIESEAGDAFTYEVVFKGDFVKTKADFTEEMYVLTALSVVQSQLESMVHQDTRLVVEQASGLITTSPLQVDGSAA